MVMNGYEDTMCEKHFTPPKKAKCIRSINKRFGDEVYSYCHEGGNNGEDGMVEGSCPCEDIELECPECGRKLIYYGNWTQILYYCYKCKDVTYSETGENIGRIE